MATREPVNLPSSGADQARRGLVSLNRLDYTLQPDLSVCVNRSYKKHFFQQQSYSPQQRAICILNSGAEYVDPQNSYLQFQVNNTSTGVTTGGVDFTLGVGSAVNFIRRIVITSRSGDELERIERVNQLSPLIERFDKSEHWIRTVGAAAGFSCSDRYVEAGPLHERPYYDNTAQHRAVPFQDVMYQGPDPAGTVQPSLGYAKALGPTSATSLDSDIRSNVTPLALAAFEVAETNLVPMGGCNRPGIVKRGSNNYFVIPLSCISGLFRSTDRLLPSMLCSGMRIEIEFESAHVAGTARIDHLVAEAAGATIAKHHQVPTTGISWTIEKPEIVLDQYQLTDSIQRVMNEEAAMRGLEVVYKTWFNSNQSITTSEATMEIRKAVSRALCLIAKTRDNEYGGVLDACVDNFSSRDWETKEWQVRIGSLYFPQQPTKGHGNNQQSTVTEAYMQTLHGFGKLKTPSAAPSVSLADFRGFNQLCKLINGAVDPTNTSATTFVNRRHGLGCFVTDLERSNVQRLTGIPINNSRVAELRLTFDTDNIAASYADSYPRTLLDSSRTVDAWLCYVRLLRVFLQNVEVEE